MSTVEMALSILVPSLLPRTSQKRKHSEIEDNAILLGQRDGHSSLDIHQSTVSTETPQREEPAPMQSIHRADLTTENLLRHTQSFDPAAGIIMGAPTHQTTTNGNESAADSRQALEDFGIDIGTHEYYPAGLKQHIETYIKKSSSIQSPSAGWMKNLEKVLTMETEATLVRSLAPLALFGDKISYPFNGPDYIRLDFNVSFWRHLVNNGRRQLTQPQADMCVGYVRQYQAEGRTSAKFTKDEEAVLLKYNASTTKETLFPFVIGQAKTAQGNYDKAILQSARDATALSRSIQKLCEAAGEALTVVDTLHWSVTCNARELSLHIHWSVQQGNGSFRHYMKEFAYARLSAEGQGLPEYRAYMRNILDFALEQRVQRLKYLVHKIKFQVLDSAYVGSPKHAMSPPSQSTSIPSRRKTAQQGFSTPPQPYYVMPISRNHQTPPGQDFWSSRYGRQDIIGKGGYAVPVPPSPPPFAVQDYSPTPHRAPLSPRQGLQTLPPPRNDYLTPPLPQNSHELPTQLPQGSTLPPPRQGYSTLSSPVQASHPLSQPSRQNFPILPPLRRSYPMLPPPRQDSSLEWGRTTSQHGFYESPESAPRGTAGQSGINPPQPGNGEGWR